MPGFRQRNTIEFNYRSRRTSEFLQRAPGVLADSNGTKDGHGYSARQEQGHLGCQLRCNQATPFHNVG